MGQATPEFDEMGPVDYLVVEFPVGHTSFSGEMAAELTRLSDEGTIRDPRPAHPAEGGGRRGGGLRGL